MSTLSIPVTSGVRSALSRVRAAVLLAGSVRASRFSRAIQRAVLDLPIDERRSLMSYWLEEAAGLARLLGVESLKVRVVVDHTSPLPTSASVPEGVDLIIDRDPCMYRGTGGILRDLSSEYDDEDCLVVLNGAQLLTRSLADATLELAERGTDIALVGHEDGTPSGMMFIRCGCLRAIPEVGFIDLKEQALPELARRYPVDVVRTAHPTGMPIRSAPEYISSLRRYHRVLQGANGSAHDAFAEEWSAAFSLVEEPRDKDAQALVLDSVVLRGGRIGRDAVVMRSVVCPGGQVARGRTVSDALIEGPRAVEQEKHA